MPKQKGAFVDVIIIKLNLFLQPPGGKLCYGKTYPGFFKVQRRLRGQLNARLPH